MAGKERSKRVLKMVNFVLTPDERKGVDALRKQLALGFEPIAIAVLLEWFYLRAKDNPQLVKLIGNDMQAFQMPHPIVKFRNSMRLDETVVDWLVDSFHPDQLRAISFALMWLAKEGKDLRLCS